MGTKLVYIPVLGVYKPSMEKEHSHGEGGEVNAVLIFGLQMSLDFLKPILRRRLLQHGRTILFFFS